MHEFGRALLTTLPCLHPGYLNDTQLVLITSISSTTSHVYLSTMYLSQFLFPVHLHLAFHPQVTKQPLIGWQCICTNEQSACELIGSWVAACTIKTVLWSYSTVQAWGQGYYYYYVLLPRWNTYCTSSYIHAYTQIHLPWYVKDSVPGCLVNLLWRMAW